jgi:hypothetical protein
MMLRNKETRASFGPFHHPAYHSSVVPVSSLSLDGWSIVTAPEDGTVRMVNMGTGRACRIFEDHRENCADSGFRAGRPASSLLGQ